MRKLKGSERLSNLPRVTQQPAFKACLLTLNCLRKFHGLSDLRGKLELDLRWDQEIWPFHCFLYDDFFVTFFFPLVICSQLVLDLKLLSTILTMLGTLCCPKDWVVGVVCSGTDDKGCIVCREFNNDNKSIQKVCLQSLKV